MGWENNIKKQTRFDTSFDEVVEAFEKVTSHPNFKHDESFYWSVYDSARQVYLRVADGSPLLEAIRDVYGLDNESGRFGFRDRKEQILHYLKQDLETLAKVRSERWLETIMGTYSDRITNPEIRKAQLKFGYDGLNYRIGRALIRITNGRFRIDICVLPADDTLPFHDHAANVFLAILNSPEGLDVLNFGIGLANILKSSNYNTQVSIFSPFNKKNNENTDFTYFLKEFKLRDVTYPLLYEKINELYKEIFGKYWEDS